MDIKKNSGHVFYTVFILSDSVVSVFGFLHNSHTFMLFDEVFFVYSHTKEIIY